MHCATAAGMTAYLVTDCRLLDKEHPWTGPMGTFSDMVQMLEKL